MRPLWLALGLLTRLPVPPVAGARPEEFGRAVLFYPVAGLLIGGLLWEFDLLLAGTAAPLRAALLVAAWWWLSGGLHLDGLADSADAWVGGQGDRERTLAIMKDPASGPAGVAAVVLVLLLKFAALQVLPPAAWPPLLLAPLLGRTALVVLLLTTPYVRTGGMGAAAAEGLPRGAGWLLVLLIATATAALGGRGPWLVPLLALLWGLLRWRMQARVGGVTGDLLGAAAELSEVVVLLALLLRWA